MRGLKRTPDPALRVEDQRPAAGGPPGPILPALTQIMGGLRLMKGIAERKLTGNDKIVVRRFDGLSRAVDASKVRPGMPAPTARSRVVVPEASVARATPGWLR